MGDSERVIVSKRVRTASDTRMFRDFRSLWTMGGLQLWRYAIACAMSLAIVRRTLADGMCRCLYSSPKRLPPSINSLTMHIVVEIDAPRKRTRHGCCNALGVVLLHRV